MVICLGAWMILWDPLVDRKKSILAVVEGSKVCVW